MKKLTAYILLAFMMMLIACSGDSSGEDNTENETMLEEEQTSEETAEKTEKETSESSEDTNSPGSGDAEQILRQSAKVMADLTSFLAEGEFTEDTTTNGQNEKTETKLTMEMVQDGSTQMYAQSNTLSNINTDDDTEMYLVEDVVYIKSEGRWFSMPMNSDSGQMFEMFKVLDDERLEDYVSFGKSFDVIDNDDHYLLTFSGDDEDYKSVVMGASESMLGNSLKEHYENMEITGTYEIKIDKDTYYMRGYNTEYELTTTGELGDVKTYHNSTYAISNFNEYDEITVPGEVVEQAESFQE
ncbi:DUF6612 family protein [Halobacillus seohaensis]|uniref:DUF6612 family protein n=1 Tax=Halobacillus seohaensis TaxID=447421 RepID=A0ABW2ELV8_9BACI